MQSLSYLNHIYILSFILCLMTGAATLLLSITVYKLGYKKFKFFIPLYLFYTLNIIGVMVKYYIIVNLPEGELHLLKYTVISNTVAVLAQQILLPVLVHDLCDLSYKKKANIAFIAITVFSAFILMIDFMQYPYTLERIFTERLIHYDSIAFACALLFYLVLLYCIVMIAFNYRRIKERLAKKLARVFIILGFIFYPGLIYENLLGKYLYFKENYTVFYFIPAFYFTLSIVLLFHMVRYYIEFSKNHGDYGAIDGFIKEYGITERETQVVKLLLNGCSNDDICDELSITQNTVKTHLKNLFQKSGARSRTELVSIIIREK